MAKGMDNQNNTDLFHGDGNSTVALPQNVSTGKYVQTNPYTTRKGPAPKWGNKHAVQPGWSK